MKELSAAGIHFMPISVDNPKTRQAVLNSTLVRVSQVPCIIELFEDGKVVAREGEKAQAWLIAHSPEEAFTAPEAHHTPISSLIPTSTPNPTSEQPTGRKKSMSEMAKDMANERDKSLKYQMPEPVGMTDERPPGTEPQRPPDPWAS